MSKHNCQQGASRHAGSLAGLEEVFCYTTVGVNSLIALWSEEAVAQTPPAHPRCQQWRKGTGGWKRVCTLPLPVSFSCAPLSIPFFIPPWLYNLKVVTKHMLKSFSKQMQYLVWYWAQFNSPNTANTIHARHWPYDGESKRNEASSSPSRNSHLFEGDRMKTHNCKVMCYMP